MFDIVSSRRRWYFLSSFFVLSALISIVVFGLRPGIDFTGGTQMGIGFMGDVPRTEEIKSLFEESVGTEKGENVLSMFDKTGFVVRSRGLTEEETTAFASALASSKWNGSINSISTIGPSMGETFQKRAFWGVGTAIIAIIIFVALAFRRVPEGLSSWKFGMAAIAALVHDITIIIGFFAFLGYVYGVEVDALFITALLTVLGFSVNDTIVIFDRIRENLKGKQAKDLESVSEISVWQSMRRSVNTSLSTLIVVAVMLVFFTGFPSLFSFFLAVSLGLIVGTYSSIFLATPLLITWHKGS
ncbi:protein translocase subunit SecF [Candidatus Peregrinibacteria bacterium]|nr:MAG: protein translocase subunit SecF [Candidatus Peregrinibacteria bacterium]